MDMGVRVIAWNLIFLLVFVVGGILLQIFLSKLESRWPGLILPLLTFAFSLLMVLSIRDTGSVLQNVQVVLAVLLITNIPTLVLLVIYWAAREKQRVKSQIEKMKIDDL